MSDRIKVGIVGWGRFGKVLVKLFGSDDGLFQVKVGSRSRAVDNKLVFEQAEVLSCDVVIPALPIGVMEGWLKENQELIRRGEKGQLWVSVCSVMEEPERWLSKWLPEGQDYVVTHPVFGPVSSAGGTKFEGLPWVVDGARVTESKAKLDGLIEFWERRGIVVQRMIAKEHDKTMARSQAVAFLVGRIGEELGFGEGELDTVGFKHLLANQRIYEGDSRQLLADMFTYNRQAREMLCKFRESVTGFEEEVAKSKVSRKGGR